MNDLQFDYDEGILLQAIEVERYGVNEDTLEEMILTNKNIFCIYAKRNGLFSKPEKIVDKIPLESIKVVNGKAQIMQIVHADYGDVVQFVYKNSRREYFSFNESEKEVAKWINTINTAITGDDTPLIVIDESKKKKTLRFFAANKKDTVDNGKQIPIKKVVTESVQTDNKVSDDPVVFSPNFINAAQTEKQISEDVSTPMSDDAHEISFYSHCGQQLTYDAMFCSRCGTPTMLNQADNYTERKQEFAGKIIKCPNCGEVLNSFVSNCPSCGYELRGAKSSNSVREFATKLGQIEEKRESKKGPSSIIGKIYGSDGQLTKTDEQKINLIRSFSVPNTKEDVLEFMILASSNIDVSVYGWGDKGVITESRKAVSEAWIAKMEQVYEKAKLTFGNTPEFQNIEEKYIEKVKEVKKRKRGIWITLVGLNVALWGLIGLIMLATKLTPEPTIEKQIENRQKHLEFLVERIEDDIADGKFTDARNKAYTLTFDEALDPERHNYWEQKQQDILEQIERASGEKTY